MIFAVVGIETILTVLGLDVVTAIAVGASRMRRKASDTQVPKSAARSTVRKKP